MKNMVQLDEMKTSPNLTPLVGLFESILSSNEKKILSSNEDLLLYRKYVEFLVCLTFVTPFNFNQLHKICKNLFDIGVLNNDESIMLNPNNAINKIIENASLKNVPELVEMFTKSYESLTKNKMEIDNENTLLIVQACLSSNIIHLLKIFKSECKNLYAQYEDKIFSLFCELMENENIYLYRAILKDIYQCIDIASVKVLITEFIYKGFASMDDDIIIHSYNLILDIYTINKFRTNGIQIYLPKIITNFYTIFKNNGMKYHQVNTLTVIDRIFKANKMFILNNFSLFFKLFLKFADFIFDQKINDGIYRYSLINKLLDCFSTLYAIIYEESNAQSEVIIWIEKTISNILKSIPSIDSLNYKMASIVKFVDATCNKKCKGILWNSPSISKIREPPIYEQISLSIVNDGSYSDDDD